MRLSLSFSRELDVGAERFELLHGGRPRAQDDGLLLHADRARGRTLEFCTDPVLDEAVKADDPETAILNLKVCDPAVGSGHFLIAAAHRMAKRLASARTGEDEPSPEAVRSALRDVVGHCLYGVDQNPMAVELCKVNLWLEAMEPESPSPSSTTGSSSAIASLVRPRRYWPTGSPTPRLSRSSGTTKELARKLKKENRAEREGRRFLPLGLADAATDHPDLSRAVPAVDSISEASREELRRKEEAWHVHQSSPEFRHAKLVADAWCAAFVWRKHPGAPPPITQDVFLTLRSDPAKVSPDTLREIQTVGREVPFLPLAPGVS